jgi:hypothetical protein
VKSTRNRFALVLVFCLFFFSAARAEANFGDSAVTVAVATVSGAVLGASTLPFYEDSGDHVKNIFYGAALGAVVGVLVSAYAGVQEGPGYDDARLKPVPASALSVNDSRELRLRPEKSGALRGPAVFGEGSPVFWSQVAKVSF